PSGGGTGGGGNTGSFRLLHASPSPSGSRINSPRLTTILSEEDASTATATTTADVSTVVRHDDDGDDRDDASQSGHRSRAISITSPDSVVHHSDVPRGSEDLAATVGSGENRNESSGSAEDGSSLPSS